MLITTRPRRLCFLAVWLLAVVDAQLIYEHSRQLAQLKSIYDVNTTSPLLGPHLDLPEHRKTQQEQLSQPFVAKQLVANPTFSLNQPNPYLTNRVNPFSQSAFSGFGSSSAQNLNPQNVQQQQQQIYRPMDTSGFVQQGPMLFQGLPNSAYFQQNGVIDWEHLEEYEKWIDRREPEGTVCGRPSMRDCDSLPFAHQNLMVS